MAGSRAATPSVDVVKNIRRKKTVVKKAAAAATLEKPAPRKFAGATFPAGVHNIERDRYNQIILRLVIPNEWADLTNDLYLARGEPVEVQINSYGR